MKGKCYVLIVSTHFLKGHAREGDQTGFMAKIMTCDKKHTMRGNYGYWKQVVDDVNAGKAYLSVRAWSGKPYRSKQKEFFRMHNVGLQKAEYDEFLLRWYIDDKWITTRRLANNDGLSKADFISWFPNPPKEPLALIHFTNFRY